MAGRGKRSRGDPPPHRPAPLNVQTKQLLMSPHISAVVGDVDRDITHDANSAMMAVSFQLLPLPEKFELCILVNLSLPRQLLAPCCERVIAASGQTGLPVHPDTTQFPYFADTNHH